MDSNLWQQGLLVVVGGVMGSDLFDEDHELFRASVREFVG
jgi:hypothetical protein